VPLVFAVPAPRAKFVVLSHWGCLATICGLVKRVQGKSLTSVSTDKQTFRIRASASRLEKGFLAIPQRFKGWFPGEKGQILVVFDDEEKARELTFHPYDPVGKENRIFGLRNWFSKRNVREGDLISITLEDPDGRLYRIALDRFVRERQEKQARQKLRDAGTDSEAEQELRTLSRLTRKRPRELAQEELLRIAQCSARHPRPSVFLGAAERHEGVPLGNPRPASRVARREVSALFFHLREAKRRTVL
jgi:hypothetical protein